MKIFLVLACCLSFTIVYPNEFRTQRADSIGVERIGDKLYILHKVEEKETLYAISRRYTVSVKDIIQANPAAEFGLEIGQVIKVPAPKNTPSLDDGRILHKVQPKETLYSISRAYQVSPEDIKKWNRQSTNILDIGQELIIYPTSETTQIVAHPQPEIDLRNESYKYHVVREGETLYAISRDYDVPLEDLRSWNHLKVNDISIGWKLIVGKLREPSAIITPETEADHPIVAVNENPVTTVSGDVVYADNPPPLERENTNFVEVEENGLAELIDGSGNNRKYLALHRNAKIGTIMRVRNEMNGQEVFVRVIGKLPDTGANRNILLKISKSAYEQLGAIDSRFRVTISFIP